LLVFLLSICPPLLPKLLICLVCCWLFPVPWPSTDLPHQPRLLPRSSFIFSIVGSEGAGGAPPALSSVEGQGPPRANGANPLASICPVGCSATCPVACSGPV